MSALLPEIPDSLLSQPLDYLLAGHFRQREVLSLMVQLAEGSVPEACVAAIAGYLKTDLLLHYADEEVDLFPVLRQRCLPEDGLEAILARLHAEHIVGHSRAAALARDLSAWPALAGRPPIGSTLAADLTSFVTLERLHLALENAILIPLARARLTPADLDRIGERMRLRRLDSGAPQSGGNGETPIIAL